MKLIATWYRSSKLTKPDEPLCVSILHDLFVDLEQVLFLMASSYFTRDERTVAKISNRPANARTPDHTILARVSFLSISNTVKSVLWLETASLRFSEEEEEKRKREERGGELLDFEP